jgi:hypothetical protein
MDWNALFQGCVLLVSAGSVLLMALTLLRWVASFETRLKRMDDLIGELERGAYRKSTSE